MAEKTVAFAPIETGDLSEIPPDAPAGAWRAKSSVKKAATSKDNYPMLIIEWSLLEALTDGNEDAVGGRVADFVTFFPENHKASRMSKMRLKAMCEALNVELPSISAIKSWADLEPLIDALSGLEAEIWTKLEERKDTGEKQTKVCYTEPGVPIGKLRAVDDEEEEEEAPKASKKTAKKAARR